MRLSSTMACSVGTLRVVHMYELWGITKEINEKPCGVLLIVNNIQVAMQGATHQKKHTVHKCGFMRSPLSFPPWGFPLVPNGPSMKQLPGNSFTQKCCCSWAQDWKQVATIRNNVSTPLLDCNATSHKLSNAIQHNDSEVKLSLIHYSAYKDLCTCHWGTECQATWHHHPFS